MNGPEHYAEAERLLDSALIGGPDGDRLDYTADRPSACNCHEHDSEGLGNLAAAQVHATLALAAATVADRGIGPMELSGWRALHVDPRWREVAS